MNFNRRTFLSASLAAGTLAALPFKLRAERGAAGLYASGIIMDGLGGIDLDQGHLSAEALADVQASGLTAVHLTMGAVGDMAPLLAFEKIVRAISGWERQIDAHPQVLSRIRVAGDIDAAKRDRRTGLIYGLQDGVSFEDDLTRLESLHQLGVRVIQPTYNRRNLLGDGCMEPANAGLSRSGHEAIERMNALGILVDLSHCGRQTAADAMAASTRPVAFTHTGCAALADHPRHRSDAELRSIAETGGVAGIFIMPYLAKGQQPRAADVVAHVEHALKVAGSEHVAIGTDGMISPTQLTPEYIKAFRDNTRQRRKQGIAAPFETEEGYLFAGDLNTARRFETLGQLLLDRGHSAGTVAKVLGGNLRRVFGESW